MKDKIFYLNLDKNGDLVITLNPEYKKILNTFNNNIVNNK